jgi:hypothetical protein
MIQQLNNQSKNIIFKYYFIDESFKKEKKKQK